jgi:hypothetical protein
MSIFISYRREDTADVSGRIYDRLTAHFGTDAVFKDVDNIPLGVNFEIYLRDILEHCSVMLVVIGSMWLDVTDDSGRRRLDLPEDFVRLEVMAALERDIPIVPLLTQGTSMPRVSELPAELANLTRYQGTHVRSDPDFHSDVDRLIRHLERHVRPTEAAKTTHQGGTRPIPQVKNQETRERAKYEQASVLRGQKRRWIELLDELASRPWVLVSVWFGVNIVAFLLTGFGGLPLGFTVSIICAASGFALWRFLHQRVRGPAWVILAIAVLWVGFIIYAVTLVV